MAYYHILRKRRQDLHLTIEYVSSQTRLAPQYIQAIEEHNLDVFSDDFSFVRYFVHAYCDAIGVNWNVVCDEVDADINAYARHRSMALSQAQKKLIAQMPQGKSTSKKGAKHGKRSRFQKSVTSMSRHIRWKNKNIRKIFVILLALIVFGVGINYWLEIRSASQASQEEAKRQEELREKEEETNRLAQQRQEERESQEIQFEVVNQQENTYRISNVIETTQSFTIKVTLPEESTVNIYKDDVLLDEENEDTLYSGTFETEIEVTQPCTIAIEVGNYIGEGTTFSVGDNDFTFDATYWSYGVPAVVYIDVVSNDSLNEGSQSEQTSSESQNSSSVKEMSYEFTE